MKKYYILKTTKFFYYFTLIGSIAVVLGCIVLYIFLFHIDFFDIVSGYLPGILIINAFILAFPALCLYASINLLIHKDMYFSQFWFDREKICFQNGKKYFEMKFDDIAEAGLISRPMVRDPVHLELMYFSKRILTKKEIKKIFIKFDFNYQSEELFVFSSRNNVIEEMNNSHPDLKFKTTKLYY